MHRTVGSVVIAVLAMQCAMAQAPTPDPGSIQLPSGIVANLIGDDGALIPTDAEGLPTRRLTDGELHRLLLQLSQFMEAAGARLVRCHMEGQPFETPGWRQCVERRP